MPAEFAWSQQQSEIPMHLNVRNRTPQDALVSAEKLLTVWERLIMRDPAVLQFGPGVAPEDREALFRRASTQVGLSFSLLLHKADELVNAKGYTGWSPYFGVHMRTTAHEEGNVHAAVERRLLNEYLGARWSCQFMQLTGSAAMGLSPVSYDLFIYWAFQHIAEIAAHAGHPEHRYLALAMISQIAEHARQCSDQRDRRNFELRDQLLRSAVLTRDLDGLARRSDEMIERYGEKRVEARFEEQLSLLLQSLGLIVVGSNRGEARVDFYCIAALPNGQAYSILVEAKSSRSPYTLPAKDARAILDYIAATNSALNTLPPLRGVLIVGQDAGITLPGKLRSLETRARLPIRYCTAATLGRLRDGLSGPAHLTAFLTSLHNGTGVLAQDAFDSVIRTNRVNHLAHAEFVKTLMTKQTLPVQDAAPQEIFYQVNSPRSDNADCGEL